MSLIQVYLSNFVKFIRDLCCLSNCMDYKKLVYYFDFFFMNESHAWLQYVVRLLLLAIGWYYLLRDIIIFFCLSSSLSHIWNDIVCWITIGFNFLIDTLLNFSNVIDQTSHSSSIKYSIRFFICRKKYHALIIPSDMR